MTSPSETASQHQVVPEDDQNIPELDLKPPAPAGPWYPGVTAAGIAADEPGAPGTADAEAPFTFVTVTGSTAGQPGAGTADAEAPFTSSTAPVTGPEPAPETPLTPNGATNGANLGTRWPEIQAMFVDDPRASAQMAAGLVDDSIDAFVVSLKEQQHALLRAWQGDDPGTEELRTTVQQYRAFWNRLEDFSRQA